jgi:hypothetical protein
MTLSRARILCVFLSTLLTHAYFTGKFSWNQASRLAAVLTFVEPGPNQGTFRIDGFDRRNPRAMETHDWSVGVDGFLYPNKAPGASMLALPAYAALYAVEAKRGIDVRDLDWTLWNAATVNRIAAPIWTASATAVLLVFLVSGGWSLRDAALPVLAYAFGSLVWPFGTSLWGHSMSAASLLISLCLVLWPGGVRHAALAGVFGGLAVVIDYPAALVLAPIGLIMLGRPSSRRTALMFAAGAAIPLAVLLAYQKLVFGGFFTATVVHGNPEFLTEGQALGVLGMVRPGVIWMLSFSPYRGLFLYCPVLVMAAAGAWRLWQTDRRWFVAAGVMGVAATMVFVSSFNGWWGGACTGPRYLIVVIPVLVLLLPAWSLLTRFWQWAYAGALAVSIANMLAISAVEVMADPAERNPLYGFVYSRLLTGQYPRSPLSGNLGASLFGLHPALDLVPVFMLIGVVLVVLWRPRS